MRNRASAASRSVPMIESVGPVMPTSVRYAVPLGQHPLVGRLHVGVRADHGAHPAVEVPAHGVLLGRRLGVEVHEDHARAPGERLDLARRDGADGSVNVERFAEELRMSKARLAETFGIALATLQRKARAAAPKTQTRLREGLEIINRVSAWAGGPLQAMAWYRAEPIPAFGGRTAESLVKDGKADAVRDYLDSVALGGFA